MSKCAAHRSSSCVEFASEDPLFDQMSPSPSIMSTSTEDSHECNSGCLAGTLQCIDDYSGCVSESQVCPCSSTPNQATCSRNNGNERDKGNGNLSQVRSVEECERSRSQTRERSRGRSRGKSRGKSHGKSRSRSRSRSRGKSRGRSHGKSRSRSRGRSRCRSRGRSRSKSRGRRIRSNSKSKNHHNVEKHDHCHNHLHKHGCKNKLAKVLKHRLMMSGHFHKNMGHGHRFGHHKHHGHHGHPEHHGHPGHHGHNSHHMMKRARGHHGMKPMPRSFKNRPEKNEMCRSFRRVRQLGRSPQQRDEIYAMLLQAFDALA